MLHALRNNRAVGILPDMAPPAGSGIRIDFLGSPAHASTAPARLAALTGAAVIPVFAPWSEKLRCYTLRLLPPVPITGDEVAGTRRIHAVIETAVREHPEQFLWLLDRWAVPDASAC